MLSRRTALSRAPLSLLVLWGFVSCAPVSTVGLRTVAPETVGLSPEKLSAVHDCLQELVDARMIAGGVALVARHGRIAYLDAVGMQDVEAGVPMNPRTIFRICSMTKPITSVGIMILEENGRLSLDDPVSNTIPEFRKMQVAIRREVDGKEEVRLVPAERQITIRDLLTHTSGLTYTFQGRAYFSDLYRKAGVSDGLAETEGTMGDNVRRLARLPLMFQPGTEWEYSLATDVLGHVIEVVSGRTLDEFVRDRIFEPLGMKDTHFLVPRKKRPRLAAVYQPSDDRTIERLPEGIARTEGAVYSSTYPLQEETGFFSGGAGLVSTAPDYARFLQMLLNGGELAGRRLLRKETVERMTRDHLGDLGIKLQARVDGFGLGFGVVTGAARDPGLGPPGSYTWGGFFHTYFWVDPKEDLIGIVMTQLFPWGHLTLFSDFRNRTYDALVN